MADQPVTAAILNEALSRFGKQLDVRFDGIDTRLDAIERRLDGMDARFVDIERRLGEMRAEMDSRFDELYGHVDGLYQRMAALETEYHMLVAGMKRIEERLDRMDDRRRAQPCWPRSWS